MNRGSQRTVLVLAAVILASLLVSRAIAEDAPPAVPKITAARVGLSNHYKLGSWTPITIDVSGSDSARDLHVNVTVSDSDGVATTASAPLASHGSATGARQVVAYTQVGRIGSPVRIVLTDGERQIDELVLQPSARSKAHGGIVPMSATSQLILSLGSAKYGLSDAFPDRAGSGAQTACALIEINKVADLPAEWFGYDAVDVVVIAANDGKLCEALAADKQRFAALQRWVQLGGRLIILCGGANAKAMLEPGGPLAAFAPGKLAEVVNLPDAIALENFAVSSPRIAAATIPVPRLQDVDGKIEAYAGRRPTDLPLVVRSPRGFGEIAFVALEFNQPPLSEWPERMAFLQALLRPYLADATATDTSQRLATSGITDLSAALRQQLGRSFSSVAPIGFAAVTGLTVAYLLFLGPLDYFVVHRWLRRPLVAWITFPLIVLAFAAAALAIGNWSKGTAGTRVNRLTLVDFDTISGQSRGTMWSAVFSPDANRFDLAVKPPVSGAAPTGDPGVLFSWWGLPGGGIGGMQAGGDLGIIQHGYRYGPRLDSLEGLPILASGAKSLVARWAAMAPAKIDARLSDADDLLIGSIANETSFTLLNARLLYGSWGYQLGNLNPGERVEITDELSPRHAKTILTRDALGGAGTTAAQFEGRVFSAEQASPKQILNLMMFYEAAGGPAFAHLPNRCQTYCDLSRQLELGRAVLVAEVAGAGAELIDQTTGQVLDGASDTPSTVYRFILPVNKPAAEGGTP